MFLRIFAFFRVFFICSSGMRQDAKNLMKNKHLGFCVFFLLNVFVCSFLSCLPQLNCVTHTHNTADNSTTSPPKGIYQQMKRSTISLVCRYIRAVHATHSKVLRLVVCMQSAWELSAIMSRRKYERIYVLHFVYRILYY